MPSHAWPELLRVYICIFLSPLYDLDQINEPRRTSTHDENALETSTTMRGALRRDPS
jgi:hypothetical protein